MASPSKCLLLGAQLAQCSSLGCNALCSYRGGAHHASVLDLFLKELNVRLVALDELSSVIKGLNAMLEVSASTLCCFCLFCVSVFL